MAKLTVLTKFRDKNDHKTVYKAGKILEIGNEARAKDLVDRGLCKEYGGNKAADITVIE
ncbi:MAG: hypothetical protein IJV09_00125 [Prevotella sp.]|nr:hypothetical protein [Prevotella sp.]